MRKSKVKYHWDDTGTMEIEIHGNEYANIRYRPSSKFVQETLAKFSKNAANQSKTESNKLIPISSKTPQKRFKSKIREYPKSSFSELSCCVKENMLKGNWDLLADNFDDMAKILCKEKRHIDEIKCLLLSFHIRMNTGEFVIDSSLVERIKIAARFYNIHCSEVILQYRELVKHPVTPTLNYEIDEACQIIRNIWSGIW